MAARDLLGLLKEAFKEWNEDNAPRLGAALSYYTIFSIAPLLLISSIVVLQVLNNGVSLAVITVLFALIFKYLPDAHPPVAWKDIWIGAVITAALFTLGKFGIGLYLGRSSVASAYGAAGSLVLLLVWVYYSAQILFYGAELTQVYARRHGSRLVLPAGEKAKAPPAPAEDDSVAPARSAAARMPTPEPPRPPTTDVGKGLALSAVLLLVGLLPKKRWPR